MKPVCPEGFRPHPDHTTWQLPTASTVRLPPTSNERGLALARSSAPQSRSASFTLQAYQGHDLAFQDGLNSRRHRAYGGFRRFHEAYQQVRERIAQQQRSGGSPGADFRLRPPESPAPNSPKHREASTHAWADTDGLARCRAGGRDFPAAGGTRPRLLPENGGGHSPARGREGDAAGKSLGFSSAGYSGGGGGAAVLRYSRTPWLGKRSRSAW